MGNSAADTDGKKIWEQKALSKGRREKKERNKGEKEEKEEKNRGHCVCEVCGLQ